MKILYSLLLFSIFGNEWFSDFHQVDSLQQKCYDLFVEDLDRALVYADSSINLAQHQRYIWAEANGYYIKGYIYRQKNDINKAFFMYLEAAEILKFQDDEPSAKLYTSILLNSGIILRQTYLYNNAIEFYDTGIDLARKWGFIEQEQKLLYNKAFSLWKKDYPEALEALRKSESMARELGKETMVIKCKNLIGLIYNDLENYADARVCFLSILNSQHANERDRADALHNMALTYKSENADSTRHCLDKALVMNKKLADPKMLYRTLYELAEWNFHHGALDQVNYWGEQTKSIYPELPLHPDYYEIFYLLGKANLKNAENANLYFTRYHDESSLFHDKQERIIKQLSGFQIDLIQTSFELERKIIIAQAKFNRNLTIIISLIILIIVLGIGYFREKRKRKQRTRQVQQILEKQQPMELF